MLHVVWDATKPNNGAIIWLAVCWLLNWTNDAKADLNPQARL